MGRILTKDQIAAADRRKHIDIDVPEWGGLVRLTEMTASDRDQWESEGFTVSSDGKAKFNPRHYRARLLVRCLTDEKGFRIYTDDEVAAVGSLSASTVQTLFSAAQDLNALSNQAIKAIEGNSEAGPSDGDSSTSVSASE